MKKPLMLLLLVTLVTLMAVPAFAADVNDSYNSYYEQAVKAKKAWVDQMVSQGYLTKEQGETYKKNIDQMYQYRMKNGVNYSPMGWGCMGMYYGGYGYWPNNSPSSSY